jgi:hypothetical protein
MPIIDLAFDLRGSAIPLDYGYTLCATICRVVPSSTETPASASTRSAASTPDPAG